LGGVFCCFLKGIQLEKKNFSSALITYTIINFGNHQSKAKERSLGKIERYHPYLLIFINMLVRRVKFQSNVLSLKKVTDMGKFLANSEECEERYSFDFPVPYLCVLHDCGRLLRVFFLGSPDLRRGGDLVRFLLYPVFEEQIPAVEINQGKMR